MKRWLLECTEYPILNIFFKTRKEARKRCEEIKNHWHIKPTITKYIEAPKTPKPKYHKDGFRYFELPLISGRVIIYRANKETVEFSTEANHWLRSDNYKNLKQLISRSAVEEITNRM